MQMSEDLEKYSIRFCYVLFFYSPWMARNVFFSFHFLSPGKNRRLKQAKEEAQAEIEQYRLQREKEFKTKEAAVRHQTTVIEVDVKAYFMRAQWHHSGSFRHIWNVLLSIMFKWCSPDVFKLVI